jgi:hypothetical protein
MDLKRHAAIWEDFWDGFVSDRAGRKRPLLMRSIATGWEVVTLDLRDIRLGDYAL